MTIFFFFFFTLTSHQLSFRTERSGGDIGAGSSTEVLIALSCDSRAQVDDLVAKAVAAGGNTYNQPQDHGFMYGHGYQDLDGHVWELFWMDPAVAEGASDQD